MARLTGAVLAGGKSSRFGTNKVLCDQLYISANNNNAVAYRDMGADIICDLHPDCGPLGGIEAIVNVCHTEDETSAHADRL